MTRKLPRPGMLVVMAVFEAIYIVIATLWNVLMLVAVCIIGRYLLKLRARQRRVNQLIDRVRVPVERAAGPYRAVAMGGVALLERLGRGVGPDVRHPVLTPARGRQWVASTRDSIRMAHRRAS